MKEEIFKLFSKANDRNIWPMCARDTCKYIGFMGKYFGGSWE
jgi:hypothetical protein